MIISYSVENFKSIKNKHKVDIWFTPGNSRTKMDHISKDGCLKSTAIFGANASGKSSLIKGMKFLKKIITDPYYSSREPIYHWDSKSNITKFEMMFNIINKFDICTTYRYAINVRTVGKKEKSRVSKQLFTFEVAKEELYIVTENGDDKMVFLREDAGNNAENNNPLIEMYELKEKLGRTKEKYSSIEALIKSLRMKIKNLVVMTRYFEEEEIPKMECELKRNKSTVESINSGKITQLSVKNLEKRNVWLEEMIQKSKKTVGDAKAKIETKTMELSDAEKEKNRLEEIIRYTMEGIKQKRIEVNKYYNPSGGIHPIISTGRIDSVEKNMKDEDVKKHIESVYKWFVSTLVILETDDFYLPLNQPNVLENISEILRSLDVGIYSIKWKKSDYASNEKTENNISTIELIKNQISENDRKKLDDCERNSTYSSSLSSVVIKTKSELNLFTYWKGEETVEKLVAYHNHNTKTATDITVESDGTRRLIELVAILLPTDNEKIFVIDEIERRLHPSLTKRLIELFFEDKNGNKQLIFSTHETLLMTRELFRTDEIQLMYMSDDGSNTSQIEGLDAIISGKPDMLKKNLKRLYLDDKDLPGIPIISD